MWKQSCFFLSPDSRYHYSSNVVIVVRRKRWSSGAYLNSRVTNLILNTLHIIGVSYKNLGVIKSIKMRLLFGRQHHRFITGLHSNGTLIYIYEKENIKLTNRYSSCIINMISPWCLFCYIYIHLYTCFGLPWATYIVISNYGYYTSVQVYV